MPSSVFEVLSRVAFLSLHTSPLTQPGRGDSGGMNVYVRELVAALAHTGVECCVYVAALVGRPARGRQGRAGRARRARPGRALRNLQKEELYDVVDDFADGVLADFRRNGRPDVVHANYWLSGVAGHRIKHELGTPLVATFHTLARVKAENGDHEPARRVRAEAEVIACADAITASGEPEAQQLVHLYGADERRVEIVEPGVEHALFSPGDRAGARAAIGAGEGPLVLFVGRIQPLKGPSVAVESFVRLDRPDAQMVIVGGPSGVDGDAEMARITRLVERAGIEERVRFVAPVPHHLLGSYYRAADVVLVPSRSESFGLVALEAASCGAPVVAAAVGGLRTLVDHGRTGFLVEGRDPKIYSAYVEEILDNSLLAAEMAHAAAANASRYTWRRMAQDLQGVYAAGRRSCPGRLSRMSGEPTSAELLDALESRIDGWLAEQAADNPTVTNIERGEPAERRWYVRLRGEEKDTFTVWFTLRQRTLHYETHVMPSPQENRERVYEYLLRRNAELYGMAFTVGAEDAVYLAGQLDVSTVDAHEVDRILGSTYAYVERCFRPAMRLGFASVFRG